jgi:hypothetical protein
MAEKMTIFSGPYGQIKVKTDEALEAGEWYLVQFEKFQARMVENFGIPPGYFGDWKPSNAPALSRGITGREPMLGGDRRK